ncbi:MAG: T9SS type A sorting domain-containing protein [Bacteroidia bacterium]
MKKYLLIVITLSICVQAKSQTTFHKCFAQNSSDGNLFSIVQTPDGGYATCGNITDNITSDYDGIIIKTDMNGNTAWIKTRGFIGNNVLFSDLIVTNDGGLAVTISGGTSPSFQGYAQIIKFDLNGNELWHRVLTNGARSANSIEKDALGNLYVLGETLATTGEYLVKLDSNGNILQQIAFDSPGNTISPITLLRTSNGDFLMSSYLPFTGTGQNILLIKTDSNFNFIWNKYFSSNFELYNCFDLKEKPNGNYLMTGRYVNLPNSINNMLIAEMDTSGSIVWSKQYAGSGNFYLQGNGIEYANGTITVAGQRESPFKTVVLSTDNTGNVLWSKKISNGITDYATKIISTTGGGFTMCGSRTATGGSVLQLLKITGAGTGTCNDSIYNITSSNLTLSLQPITISLPIINLVDTTTQLIANTLSGLSDACQGVGMDETANNSFFMFFPNPATDFITIQYNLISPKETNVSFFNIYGQVVKPLTPKGGLQNAGKQEMKIDIKDLPQGIYFVKVSVDGKEEVRKVVKY